MGRSIQKLESLNDYNSEDVRLLAESEQAVRSRILDLGLDPDDTTGEELYHALLVKFELDSALIDKALGITGGSSFTKRLNRAVALLTNVTANDEMWVLKHSVAKRLLREHPPKKLMKQLGYRSVDSMLKRESLANIFISFPLIESSSWQKAFHKETAKLDSADYELRIPGFYRISEKNWASFIGPKSGVSSNSLIGVVAVWPELKLQKAGVLALALRLIDGLEDITHSETTISLANINPALNWWEQSKHLIALCGKETVSLNYKDVAANHLNQISFQKRLASSAQKSLWNELSGRYEREISIFEGSLADIENDASQEFNKLANVPLPSRLAAEYAEV